MEETLEEIGLSKNEAKVYCVLNELGSSTAGTIAAQSKLHRPNVYDALKRLVNKGLVFYIAKGNTNFYNTTAPESLLKLLEEKQNKINGIIPQLKLAKDLSKSKDEAHIMQGIQGIKWTLNDALALLKQGEELVMFGVPREASERIKHFVPHFHKRRIAAKIIHKHIYNQDATERIKYLNSLDYTEAVFLPKEYNSPVTTSIYANKVVFWLWEKEPLTVVIESEAMAKAYRKYFYLLWDIAHS